MNDWHLTPAYGRDYKSKREALEDFNSGKDFVLNTPRGSTYCSKRDVPSGALVQIRYKRLMQVFVFKA